jgi:hypothetical protein
VLNSITYQVDRYLGTNALKRKWVASDVRHKLKNLAHTTAFYTRLFDSVYVNPPSHGITDKETYS